MPREDRVMPSRPEPTVYELRCAGRRRGRLLWLLLTALLLLWAGRGVLRTSPRLSNAAESGLTGFANTVDRLTGAR